MVQNVSQEFVILLLSLTAQRRNTLGDMSLRHYTGTGRRDKMSKLSGIVAAERFVAETWRLVYPLLLKGLLSYTSLPLLKITK